MYQKCAKLQVDYIYTFFTI